jgi:hypothetical protein
LPVVTFDDWIKKDGRAVVLGRAAAEEDGKVASLLKDLGASGSVLLGTPLQDAVNGLLAGVDEKKRKPLQTRAAQLLTRDAEFSRSGGPTIEWLRSEYAKTYAAVIKELMTHRLSGFYFLPRLEPQEEMGCYVALLRQIGAMPSRIASEIPVGIDAAKARQMNCSPYLKCNSRDDYVMPIGVLASPYVEHLMQTFSFLLARIGLPNTDQAHIDRYALEAK